MMFRHALAFLRCSLKPANPRPQRLKLRRSIQQYVYYVRFVYRYTKKAKRIMHFEVLQQFLLKTSDTKRLGDVILIGGVCARGSSDRIYTIPYVGHLSRCLSGPMAGGSRDTFVIVRQLLQRNCRPGNDGRAPHDKLSPSRTGTTCFFVTITASTTTTTAAAAVALVAASRSSSSRSCAHQWIKQP